MGAEATDADLLGMLGPLEREAQDIAKEAEKLKTRAVRLADDIAHVETEIMARRRPDVRR